MAENVNWEMLKF